MFGVFGGVTAIIVLNNLKAAVTHPDRRDLAINRSEEDMARHHGATVIPARPNRYCSGS
jgi:hypothetical protein